MKYRTKILLLFLSVTILTNGITTVLIYHAMERLVFHLIQSNVLSIAATASALLDGDLHHPIKTRADEARPEYLELVRQLRRVRDANRRPDTFVKFCYTMMNPPGHKEVVQFGADAEESAEDVSHVGDVYKEEVNNGNGLDVLGVSRHYVTDEWGTWLSAWAPLKDSSGHSVAAVGVDFSADKVNQRLRHALLIGVMSFGLSGLVSFAAAVLISRRLSGPLLVLRAGLETLRQGHLDSRVSMDTHDEFSEVADDVNKMASDLTTHIEQLRSTTAAKERMESELRVAHDIQMGIVPKVFPAFPTRPEVDVYAVIEPAREVGGDLYDFFFIDDEHLCLVIGDVSDKGVPASLFMAVTKTLIKSTATEVGDPAEVLARTNRELAQDNPSCMFVTVFCAVLHTRSGELRYASAGHNPPLLLRREGSASFLSTEQGMAIGVFEEAEYVTEAARMEPGDTLFMYTDGVTEAANTETILFSAERLRDAAHAHASQPVVELVNLSLQDVKDFVDGAPQADDITICVVRYQGRGDSDGNHRSG